MPLHVAVLTIPAHGHVNPALAITEELIQRGHRVSFIASSRFEDAVRKVGASYVPYATTWSESAQSGQVGPDDAASVPLRYFEENLAQLPVAEDHFSGAAPDIVLFDSHATFAGRALAQKFELPSVVLNATFASNNAFSLSRTMTARFEKEAGKVDPQHPNLVLFGRKLSEFLSMHDLGLSSIGEFEIDKSALNLVCTSKEFQICGETFGDDYAFLGSCVAQYRLTGSWEPAAKRPNTVLVSMGTEVNDQSGLFRTCAEAFDEKTWQVVLVIGSSVDPAALGPLPDNVEVHRSVPQPLVLRRVDAFLSHGGMNSTMESLSAGVPLLVVPVTPEQEIIANRVAELGLGRRLDLTSVGPETLPGAVTDVARDSAIAQKITEFRDHLRNAGAPYAANEIERKAGSS